MMSGWRAAARTASRPPKEKPTTAGREGSTGEAPLGAEVGQREECGGHGHEPLGSQSAREGLEVGAGPGRGVKHEDARAAPAALGHVEVGGHVALAAGVVRRLLQDALGPRVACGERRRGEERAEDQDGAGSVVSEHGRIGDGAPHLTGGPGMSETMRTIHFTRRTLLRGLALLGVAGAILPLVGAPRPAAAQGNLANPRLNETGDVRAVAEISDGTLLMAKREVKVTVGGCGG